MDAQCTENFTDGLSEESHGIGGRSWLHVQRFLGHSLIAGTVEGRWILHVAEEQKGAVSS